MQTITLPLHQMHPRSCPPSQLPQPDVLLLETQLAPLPPQQLLNHLQILPVFDSQLHFRLFLPHPEYLNLQSFIPHPEGIIAATEINDLFSLQIVQSTNSRS